MAAPITQFQLLGNHNLESTGSLPFWLHNSPLEAGFEGAVPVQSASLPAAVSGGAGTLPEQHRGAANTHNIYSRLVNHLAKIIAGFPNAKLLVRAALATLFQTENTSKRLLLGTVLGKSGKGMSSCHLLKEHFILPKPR